MIRINQPLAPHMDPVPDAECDARGLLCPLPVLRARKRLLAMQPDEVLCLRTSDPAAIVDVPHFCREAGHDLIATETPDTGETAFLIRRR